MAALVTIAASDTAAVSHVLTPTGMDNGWQTFRQITPAPATPMDGFFAQVRLRTPPANAQEVLPRRAEFRIYRKTTSSASGIPVITKSLFAEMNFVIPGNATDAEVEEFRNMMSTFVWANASLKDVIVKGHPLF